MKSLLRYIGLGVLIGGLLIALSRWGEAIADSLNAHTPRPEQPTNEEFEAFVLSDNQTQFENFLKLAFIQATQDGTNSRVLSTEWCVKRAFNEADAPTWAKELADGYKHSVYSPDQVHSNIQSTNTIPTSK